MEDKQAYEEAESYIKEDRRAGRHAERAEDAPEPEAAEEADETEARDSQEASPAVEAQEPEEVGGAQETPQADPPQSEPTESYQEVLAEEPDGTHEDPMEGTTLADLGVYGILRFSVGLVIQQAWIALGLQAPSGGETQENLPDAKVAIDALQSLVGHLGPDLDDEEKRELESTLANLRINFVQRAS